MRVREQLAGVPRRLLWLSGVEHIGGPTVACRFGRYQLGESTFFAHLALDAGVPELLKDHGRGWHPERRILDADRRPVASIWQADDGSRFLPFDPGEAMRQFWSEKYLETGQSYLAAMGHNIALRGYYLARPAVPRRLQLRLRRAYTNLQGRSTFPEWPIEDSLHSLYTELFTVAVNVADRPVPYIDLWPDGRSWSLILTHDVETASGCRDINLLRDVEREFGYRSSWNFVPLRYPTGEATMRALREEGCEIGVHGLRHDGRDVRPERSMNKRLPRIREYAHRWGAVGFRSPATHRQWEIMPRLGFDYDSSYSDTDPYEPQPGGCCSYLPFLNQNMVELPMTLPQDHTIFSILENPDADIWLRKAHHLRERRGMVLVLTHPDYARDPRLIEGYRRLLKEYQGDDTAWHALPKEAAAWWLKRNASTIRQDSGRWIIDGAASTEGRVRFAGDKQHSYP